MSFTEFGHIYYCGVTFWYFCPFIGKFLHLSCYCKPCAECQGWSMQCWVSSVKSGVYRMTQDHIASRHKPDEYWQEAVQMCTDHCSVSSTQPAASTVHCALCTMQCEQCTVLFTSWSVHSARSTVHCWQFTVDCALFNEYYALCTFQPTLCTVHSALYTVQRALHWINVHLAYYTIGTRPGNGT